MLLAYCLFFVKRCPKNKFLFCNIERNPVFMRVLPMLQNDFLFCNFNDNIIIEQSFIAIYAAKLIVFNAANKLT